MKAKGIDDINALLFALAASPADIEVLLISVSYGNVDAKESVSVFGSVQTGRVSC